MEMVVVEDLQTAVLWEAVATQAIVTSDELTPIFPEPEEGLFKRNPTLAQK